MNGGYKMKDFITLLHADKHITISGKDSEDFNEVWTLLSQKVKNLSAQTIGKSKTTTSAAVDENLAQDLKEVGEALHEKDEANLYNFDFYQQALKLDQQINPSNYSRLGK